MTSSFRQSSTALPPKPSFQRRRTVTITTTTVVVITTTVIVVTIVTVANVTTITTTTSITTAIATTTSITTTNTITLEDVVEGGHCARIVDDFLLQQAVAVNAARTAAPRVRRPTGAYTAHPAIAVAPLMLRLLKVRQ